MRQVMPLRSSEPLAWSQAESPQSGQTRAKDQRNMTARSGIALRSRSTRSQRADSATGRPDIFRLNRRMTQSWCQRQLMITAATHVKFAVPHNHRPWQRTIFGYLLSTTAPR